ncbi:mutator type transposase [Tanacetum coccineum]
MVASIAMWSMRASQDDIDVYEAYATQETLFSLKVNYAGCFTESPGMRYVNGDFAYFDCIDIDEFLVHELNDMVKKIGFSGKNIMYISDREKGIIPAIAELFPAAEHMFCLRHIHENMKLKWRGAAYKELLWKAATALTVPYFEKVMDELKAFNKECYE